MTPEPDVRPLWDLRSPLLGRVIVFPVRHHSPTAARLVRTLIDVVRPSAVLIEGPADFNPKLAELFLPHRPPIAIYSFVRTATAGRPPSQSGVYYPFCEYSPEWQAVRHGHAAGADVRFIDLPWADSLGYRDEAINRYADRGLRRSRFVDVLTRRLQVETFDDAWDVLFEQDTHLTLPGYLERCHQVCTVLRTADAVSPLDVAREAFMAERIREQLATAPGPVVVVVGGYHAWGLYELLTADRPAVGSVTDNSNPAILERGIALTPYSFDRLDALVGYNAGMPNPGFYQQLWACQEADSGPVHTPLLQAVALALRGQNQPISAADLIAVETAARGLAAVRGHPTVWRTDLVDAVVTAVVKDDTLAGRVHPVVAAVRAVLRGGDRGRLAEGTSRPPFLVDLYDQLAVADVTPTPTVRTLELNLATPGDQARSRVLHRVRLLALGGHTLTAGALDDPTAVTPRESWEVFWTPDFDAHAIEAGRYGPTLAEAAEGKLVEDAQAVDRDAGAAARLLVDAALAGLDAASRALTAHVERLVRTDADVFGVAAALARLVFLYRYPSALGPAGRADLGAVVREAYLRALWLFETLGQTTDRDQDLVRAVRGVLHTFETCQTDLDLDRTQLLATFERLAADRSHRPVLRGAAVGGLWTQHAATAEFVLSRLNEVSDPNQLGDLLLGLFAIAREQVKAERGILAGIHGRLTGFSTDEFLTALPALRLAFTNFTPREKHHMADTLRAVLGGPRADAPLTRTPDVDTVAAGLKFEDALFGAAAALGIRSGT